MTVNMQERTEEIEDTQNGRFLTFILGNQAFGIEIKYVTEIVGMQPITQLPEVPDFIKGIINLRGQIIPVIDIRLKFKMESIEYTDRTCIIVIDVRDISVGVIVDRVAEVMKIDDKNIELPPATITGIQNKYIHGIGKVENEVKLLLACELLFAENELEVLTENK